MVIKVISFSLILNISRINITFIRRIYFHILFMRWENIIYSLKYISELFISKNNFLWKTGNIKSICMVHMIYHNITSLIWPMTEHCGTSSQVIFKICLLFCSSLSLSLSLSHYLFLPLIFNILLHSWSLDASSSIRIWDDDLCHYFLIHEYTRGRVRVSYVSLTYVYNFTYKWDDRPRHLKKNTRASANKMKLAFKY